MVELNVLSHILAELFPKPEDRLIMDHVMEAEGGGKFSKAWGAVVYRHRDGTLKCDRQWINFGLISFAYPSGAGAGILRNLLQDPEERQAFREICLRCLADQPADRIDPAWGELLRSENTELELEVMTKGQLAEGFIEAVGSGNDPAAADWVFKYVDMPATRDGVRTASLRPAWQEALSEFLDRPASRAAQLDGARALFFVPAVNEAREMGLASVRGVAFMFDTEVQSGSIPSAMHQVAGLPEFQQALEIRKLEMLRDTFTRGSTEWHRRNAVIASARLTDEPYPF